MAHTTFSRPIFAGAPLHQPTDRRSLTVCGCWRPFAKNSIRYRRYVDDFPFQQVGNIWTDTITGNFTDDKVYVVQTGVKVVGRCIHMTTGPGDLVLDITCGSGTTAYTAEQWGRRWITVDTSRVPIALARQRLLTSTFPWYRLKEPAKGPEGGFVYERKRNSKGEETGGLVPRITLKSIANDEDPKLETIIDRAEVNDKITRVCGPSRSKPPFRPR